MGNQHFEIIIKSRAIAKSLHKGYAIALLLPSHFIFNAAQSLTSFINDEEVGNLYSRFSKYYCDEFIRKLKLFKNATSGATKTIGIATASLFSLLKFGNHFIASLVMYGNLLKITCVKSSVLCRISRRYFCFRRFEKYNYSRSYMRIFQRSMEQKYQDLVWLKYVLLDTRSSLPIYTHSMCMSSA